MSLRWHYHVIGVMSQFRKQDTHTVCAHLTTRQHDNDNKRPSHFQCEHRSLYHYVSM